METAYMNQPPIKPPNISVHTHINTPEESLLG